MHHNNSGRVKILQRFNALTRRLAPYAAASFASTIMSDGVALKLANVNDGKAYRAVRFVTESGRVGTRVQQGEVIGYVGMNGLATGPHLHYEYLVDGRHENPQTVQLPGGEPLRADALQKFRETTAPLLADLTASDASLLASIN
ncbi:MAG: M23 family metallopeptidase [Gammaproteobacteria bacterium]